LGVCNGLLHSGFPTITSYYFILLGPNIVLSTLFSNTVSLCSSLNARYQVSHPYRATCKMILLYNLIFMFLNSRREDKWFWTDW
jgi:hypothetical protein